VAVLSSQVERASSDFVRRQERMEALVAELRERTAQIAQGGGERATDRHRSRGKLPARERIDRLCDPDTAFLEVSALAAWEVYDGQAPAAGIVTGIGVVEGRECVIVANDATVKGGTYFPLTVKKHLRAQEIAEQNHLPCIYLVDSGGARSSPTATTSDESSSTRPACPRRASHRSPPSWAPARPAAPTCPP
jgi:acetyl-CoA carboxylase carboxyltransferase component